MRWLSLLLCLLGFTAQAMSVGVNLPPPWDYEPGLMFADLVFHSRAWGTTANPSDEAATVDANGWPTGDAGIYLMSISGSAYPSIAGVYSMSWDSVGTPTVAVASGGAGWTLGSQTCSGGHCSRTITASSSALGTLSLTFTSTSGGIRNLKIMRPTSVGSSNSHSTSEIFTRQFLTMLAPFDFIRTMDLTITNGEPMNGTQLQRVWADRTPSNYATQTGKKISNGSPIHTGVAWEYIIALANATNKDLWINVPLFATDAYVTSLASLIKTSLNSNLKVYVEYVNEVWNGGTFNALTENYDLAMCEMAPAWIASHAYTAASYSAGVTDRYAINGGHCYKVITGGTSAASGGPTSTTYYTNTAADGSVVWRYMGDPPRSVAAGNQSLNYDGETNSIYWGFRRVAERTKEISSLFSSVFGASQMMTRVRPVLMGQGSGPPLIQGLNFLAGKYGSPSGWLYAVGQAPYFAEWDSSLTTMSVNQIFEEYKQSLYNWSVDQKKVTTWARTYGLRSMNYEGGPGSSGSASLTNKTTAQSDARIVQLIRDWLQMQRDFGVDGVAYFNLVGKWGSNSGHWGMSQDPYDLTTYKYKTMASWATYERASGRIGGTVTILGKDYTHFDGSAFASGNNLVCNATNTLIRYEFSVPARGVYHLVVSYQNPSALTLAKISVNGTAVLAGTLPDSSGTTQVLDFYPTLTPGMNTVEWDCLTSPNQAAQIVSIARTTG